MHGNMHSYHVEWRMLEPGIELYRPLVGILYAKARGHLSGCIKVSVRVLYIYLFIYALCISSAQGQMYSTVVVLNAGEVVVVTCFS